MASYDAIAELPLEIESCEFEGLEVVMGEFERLTTVIKLRGDLTEHDLLFDDGLGNETVLNPLETGWRKDVTLTFTGSSARVRANFTLTPI